MDQEYKKRLGERLKHSRHLATCELAKALQYREMIRCCRAADDAEELASKAESFIATRDVHSVIKKAQAAERAATIAETSAQIAGCLGADEHIDNVTQSARKARDAARRANMAALVVIEEYLMQDCEDAESEDMSLWEMVEGSACPEAVSFVEGKVRSLPAMKQALCVAQDVVKGARKFGDPMLVALKEAEAAGLEQAVRLLEEEARAGDSAVETILLFSTRIEDEMEKAKKINNDLKKELDSIKLTVLGYRKRVAEAKANLEKLGK